jgi:hypothetical protein
MSQLGQKHALPQRNNNGRFTSMSGHRLVASVLLLGTGESLADRSVIKFQSSHKSAATWLPCLARNVPTSSILLSMVEVCVTAALGAPPRKKKMLCGKNAV